MLPLALQLRMMLKCGHLLSAALFGLIRAQRVRARKNSMRSKVWLASESFRGKIIGDKNLGAPAWFRNELALSSKGRFRCPPLI